MQEGFVMSQEDVVAWLKERAIPVRAARPDGHREDLKPLRARVGAARIVALGESTYGTHDVFLLKYRLLEFLVEEMGFTILALPVPYVGTCAINQYVTGGDGNLDLLIGNLGDWRWLTQEMLELLTWVRQHNERCQPEAYVRVFGLDCWYIQAAIDHVVAYLERVEPRWCVTVRQLYEFFGAYDDDVLAYPQLPDVERMRNRSQLQQVYTGLLQRRDVLETASSRDAYLEALQNAQVLVQTEAVLSNGQPSLRERYMADNVGWLLESYAQEKMVLWAHNRNVSYLSLDQQPETLCAYLRERYEDELLTIGCSFNHGTFYAQNEQQANKLQSYVVDEAPKDSFEAVFGMTELPALLLDLREVDDERKRWFVDPHFSRYVSMGYTEPCWQPQFLLQCFDLYAFVQHTEGVNFLAQARSWGAPLPAFPSNLDFKYELYDWYGDTDDVRVKATLETNQFAYIQLESANADPKTYRKLLHDFPACGYHNRYIRLSAYIETLNVGGEVNIWLRIFGPEGEEPLLASCAVSGSQHWTVYKTEPVYVSSESTLISVAITLSGSGVAWVGDLQIEEVSEREVGEMDH
jgi:erythromycin esterase